MDLNGNLQERIPSNNTENITHFLPVAIKNLKRKAHHAEVLPVAKFPAENQHVLTCPKVHLQEGTAGKWKEEEDPSVCLQEADVRSCRQRRISNQSNKSEECDSSVQGKPNTGYESSREECM